MMDVAHGCQSYVDDDAGLNSFGWREGQERVVEETGALESSYFST